MTIECAMNLASRGRQTHRSTIAIYTIAVIAVNTFRHHETPPETTGPDYDS